MNPISVLVLCCGLSTPNNQLTQDSVAFWKQKAKEANLAAYQQLKIADRAMEEAMGQKKWNLQLNKINEGLKVTIEEQKKIIERCKEKN